MNREQTLVAAISAAFSGVPKGTITLHEAEVIDVYGSEEERAKARWLDQESSWECVRDTAIEECTTALCHVDAPGWRYYIPAYMIWSLRNFRVSDSIVSDHTIYTFDLSERDPGVRDYQLARFRLLNDAQSRAACRFLRFMALQDDHVDAGVAVQALDKYWGRFCEDCDA